ncbi:MAG: hypothetical protein WDO15_09140 [Bacteroidota bacterium]
MIARIYLFVLVCVIASGCHSKKPVTQITIDRIAGMPDQPSPYKMLDWKEKAINFDQYVFNATQKGEFLPFIWTDSSLRNLPQKTFGMYTVIGDVRQGPKGNKEFHEALNSMGALMGAGLVGIDKTNQKGNNYVKMVQNYFNKDNGWNIMMNNTNPQVALLGGGYGRDWWYDVVPNVLFYALCDLYPNVEGADSLQRIIADQFYKADSVLNGNYDYSYFDYGKMQPMNNHIPHQQDAAGGHAFVLYAAYKKFGDEKYLRGAISATKVVHSQKESRFYELLMPFGAYIGARLNATQGTDFEIKKVIDWTFDGCKAADGRTGWGVISERWGDYDVHGLQGSITDGGGYAFLMNSFALAWPLVPTVKYDNRYANAIGKWMLNVTNAARLCYPYEIDDQHQFLPEKKDITRNVIAYEGIRKNDDYGKESLKGLSPVATGDGPKWVKGQPQESMFSLYSSCQVGIFGAIVKKTNVEKILQLDCNATDFYADDTWPTYLYYNPYDEEKSVAFESYDNKPFDLYDALTCEKIQTNVTGSVDFAISPKSSRLIVVIPAKSKVEKNGSVYKAAGKVVAYAAPEK